MVLGRTPPHEWVAYEFFDVRPDMSDDALIEAWKSHPDPPTLAPGQTGGIVELGRCGAAGLLISSEVLRAMEPPWFEFGKAHSVGAGEDCWFVMKARRLGFRAFCDLDVKMSHMNVWSVWPKIDAKGNVLPLFQFSKAPDHAVLLRGGAGHLRTMGRGNRTDRERSRIAALLT